MSRPNYVPRHLALVEDESDWEVESIYDDLERNYVSQEQKANRTAKLGKINRQHAKRTPRNVKPMLRAISSTPANLRHLTLVSN